MKTKFLSIISLAMIFIGCGGEEVSLAAHKNNAIAILTAHVQDLNPEKYSNENWLAIEQIASTGKENIGMAVNKPEVNLALNAALKEIHLVDYEGRDFVHTITVEETTLPRGENFRVNVELKNNSGEDVEIFYDTLFFPDKPDHNILNLVFPPPPSVKNSFSSVIEAGGILRNIRDWGFDYGPRFLGDSLTLGTHKLRFYAFFVPGRGAKSMHILSNTIILTVQ